MIEVVFPSGKTLNLPLQIDDLPFQAWSRFAATEIGLYKAGAEIEPDVWVQSINLCVRDVFGEAVDELPFGDINTEINAEVAFERAEDGGDEVSEDFVSVRLKPLTVKTLYAHLGAIRSTHTPTTMPYVDADGQAWTMTQFARTAHQGEHTAQEVVETLQLRKTIEGFKEKLDDVSETAYEQRATIALLETALLLRKQMPDGSIEPLPYGEAAIVEFATNRLEAMKALPPSVILSVPFFLTLFLSAATHGKTQKEPPGALLNMRLSGAALSGQATRRTRRKALRLSEKQKRKPAQTPSRSGS